MESELRRMGFEILAGTLYARAAAPEDGPVVILLHGFPESWYSWRRQIPALASAGYHVIALDQRGYNESGKPRSVREYVT
jgi:pimeloyl-ACP methyl ester carboxylesterase